MIEVADFLNETRETLDPHAASRPHSRVPDGLRPFYGIVVAALLGLGFWCCVGFFAWKFLQ